jgi:hypothetical protein
MCRRIFPLVLIAALTGFAAGPVRAAEVNAEMVFENPRLRLVLGSDGAWRSIVDKKMGRDYCPRDKNIRFASARIGKATREANRAARFGDRLIIGLDGSNTQLAYAVATTDDWIAFRLAEVSGGRPSHLTLVRLGVSITGRVGPRLNGVWNDEYGICLRAMNLQAQGRAARAGAYAELASTTQDAPGPRLEGAAVAVLAGTPAELRAALQRLAVACGLPRNDDGQTPAKDLPLARGSYWFLSFGEKEVDKVIDYCRRTGFQQVMLSSGAWCQSVGHYTINTAYYPDGIESLRRTVARLHREGILVGMHTFASKISKTDPYVTPVPDRRFWVDLDAPLATPVGPADTAIRMAADLREWPGSPVAAQKLWEGGVAKHQEVVLDDEIIRYQAIGPDGQWDTFLGCQRGAYGTKPAAHPAGTVGRHYGIDGCINGYIVDQETTLLDETTSRLAEVFNACDFDMVYFDGGEDVDRRRFDYYVSKCQAAAMGKFRKRPMIHMGTIMTHNVWHSFTRSGTVDTYLNTLYGHLLAGGKIEAWPTVRTHIDRSVAYMQRVGDDMVPGELGWFGIWAKGKNTDGLQLDEIEYLMAKSMAYDAPISLQTSFAQMESHPLTPGILEIVGTYERLRRSGAVAEPVRQRLRAEGKDFIVLPAPGGSGGVEFVLAEALATVAGGRDLRAMAGPCEGGAVATVWHYLGKPGTLVLDTERVEARRIDSVRVATQTRGGKTHVPVDGRRTTLSFSGVPVETVRRLLAQAQWSP